jgi:endonuclease/exonuclease/phosphatase family metal-dependent hydrolase
MNAESGATAVLTVVTFNLLNDLTYWAERAPLIVAALAALQPDVIALQEVSLPLNNAAWLAEQLGGYSVHLCPKTGRKAEHEAVALLARWPVLGHETLAFGKQDRVAQRIALRHGDTTWTIANAHLHWSLYDDAQRIQQAHTLLDWLPIVGPTVLCGDFNARPDYRAIAVLRQRFASAQVNHFGAEVVRTFPTPLKRGPGMRHAARRTGLKAMGRVMGHPGESWQGTLDYIFVDRAIRVEHCARALDEPAADDPALYPSDHMSLVATLSV